MNLSVKYNIFLLERLFESVLVTSNDFYNILSVMADENNIAYALWRIIRNENDIKTNVNALGLSDKNDEVTFIPDSQYQRIISKGEDPWEKNKSKVKIGRMIRQFLKDINQPVNDTAIEEFVNKFKAKWDRLNGISTRDIKIVGGKDILYWYSEKRYFVTSGPGGTLGNSCMRYDDKNDFMKLYAENTDKVSMVILTDEGKLIARALIWKLDKKPNNDMLYYLDRIYTKNDSDSEFVREWVVENICKGDKNKLASYYDYNVSNKVATYLNNVIFKSYPYADSMSYLLKDEVDGKLTGKGFASKYYDKDDFKNCIGFTVQETDGSENCFTHRYSTKMNSYIPIESAAYVESIGSYMPISELSKCNELGRFYLKDDVVYSEKFDDYFPKDEIINHEKYGIVLPSMLVKVITEYTGKFTDPNDIWDDIEYSRGGNLEINEILKKDEGYYTPDNYPESYYYWDIKFHCRDFITEESMVNLFCYDLHKITSNNIPENAETISPYRRLMSSTAKMYGIEIEEKSRKCFYMNYYNRCDMMIFKNVLEDIKNSNLTDKEKNQQIQIFTNTNKYLIARNESYKNRNLLVNSNLDESTILVNVVRQRFSNDDKYSNDEIKDVLDMVLKHYEQEPSTDFILEMFITYLKLSVCYYTIDADMYDTSRNIRSLLSNTKREEFLKLNNLLNNDEDDYKGRILIDIFERTFRSQFSGDVNREMRNEFDEYCEKNDIKIYNMYYYLRDNLSSTQLRIYLEKNGV